jgi:probable F420-dependent oxidoreductase
MKIGVALPHTTELASLDVLDAVLDGADDAGWSSLWVQDHIAFPRQMRSKYPYGTAGTNRLADMDDAKVKPLPWWELGTVLAYAAARTSRVALGTSVIVLPLRHPLFVAKMLATVDRLSQGRLICGVGVGWLREEFDALGVGSWYESRGRVCNEYLEVMSRIWSNDYASFDGEFIQFDSVSVTPKPLQQPSPPIWIGGNGPAAWRRVARFGTGWLPLAMRAEDLEVARRGLDAELESAGRPAGSVDLALRRRVLLDGFAPAVAGDVRDRNSYVMGTAEEVVAEIRELSDAGVSHLILDPWVTPTPEAALEMAAAVASDIIPLVRTDSVEEHR